MEVSCLTKDEIDAALQLIQLTGTGTGYSRRNRTNNTATDRKLEEEEECDGNFIADVSSPSVIEKSLRRQEGSLGQRKRRFQSVVDAFEGQSRRNQNDGNTRLALEMNAARQLLQLCDDSDGHDDHVKAKKEEEEEEITSDISYLMDASSSSAMEGRLEVEENEKEAEGEEEEEEIRREGRDSPCTIKGGGAIMEEWEALCRRRRKLRSVVDIYRTTKPLKVDLLLIC